MKELSAKSILLFFCNNSIQNYVDENDTRDRNVYNAVNYFNEAFAKQVALHQLLYRKLLKFTYDNKCEDLEWDSNNEHYYIRYDYYWQYFDVEMARSRKSADVFFSSKENAQRAIKEVVEPFIKEHPEFIW